MARTCAQLYHKHQNQNDGRRGIVLAAIAECASKSDPMYREIQQGLENQIHCEDWLCAVMRIYQLLTTKNGCTVQRLAQELGKSEEQITKAAVSFTQAAWPKTDEIRFRDLRDMALLFIQKEFSQFVFKFVEYHSSVFEDRPGDPMLIFENDKLVVADPQPQESVKDIFASLDKKWDNDYYITCSRMIYSQCFKDAAV